MHRNITHRPSSATVISLIALFVALGGTSLAATKLLKNSVGSAQVINGSLQTTDLSKKAKTALKGNTGPQGAPGAAGTPGATGPQGPPGAQGATGAAGTNGTNGTNGATNVVERIVAGGAYTGGSSALAACRSGERATGGGYSYTKTGTAVPHVVYSVPYSVSATTPPTGWTVGVVNDGGIGTVTATAYVICASP